MRIVSFNINGLRARPHQLDALLQAHRPCILGLQETKVADTAFPHEWLAAHALHGEVFGEKGHYGVALLSTVPPLRVQRGFPWDPADAQRRFIAADYAVDGPGGSIVHVVNAYYPQGESRDHPGKFAAKARFFADMLRYLRECCSPGGQLLLMGDFNVAPEAADIGIPARDRERWLATGACSFLPEERAWFGELLAWGLVDAYRARPRDEDRFSWFDYRRFGFDREPKRGLRLDHLLLSAPLAARLRDCDIDYAIRGMEKPSDHAPVWAELD
jgi:exodeoxyribonuclease-3